MNFRPRIGWTRLAGAAAILGGISGILLAPLMVIIKYRTGWALVVQLRDPRRRLRTWGLWVLLLGLAMVVPGDAIHTATWHQNGLTVPTPGTNPVRIPPTPST